jgi:hypothetical protein
MLLRKYVVISASGIIILLTLPVTEGKGQPSPYNITDNPLLQGLGWPLPSDPIVPVPSSSHCFPSTCSTCGLALAYDLTSGRVLVGISGA